MSATKKSMDRDISCVNSRALIDYVSTELGEGAIDSLLDGLVDNKEFLIEDKYAPRKIGPVTLDHLLDPDYWVSNDFSLRLFENASKILPGPRSLYRAGIGVVMHQASLRRIMTLARLLPPHLFLARVPRENRKYNRTKRVSLVDQGRGRAVFELRYQPDIKVTKHVCEWNLGIYTGYGLVTGAQNIQVRETRCVTNGEPVCTFEAGWTSAALSQRIRGVFLFMLGRDLVEAYEKERLDKEDLVFNLGKRIEKSTDALRKSAKRYRSLASNLEKMVEARTEALRDSEKRYRTLIENSEDAILVFRNGQVEFANSRAFQLFGRSKKEVMGKGLVDLVLPEDREVIKGIDTSRRTRKGGQNLYDFRVFNRKGEWHWIEMNAVGCEWQGNPATLSFLRDVTERKDLEDKVRESEALYRSLVERSGDIIIQCDSNRVFTFVNPSGLTFFGKENKDLMGRCLDEYVVPEDLSKTQRHISMIFQGRDFVNFENSLTNGSGDVRLVSWTMNPVKGGDGEVIGVQAVARDITETKRQEEQAIQTEKLRALGEMAGGVAHDFNNMLAAILGRAQLLKIYMERTASEHGIKPDSQVEEGLDIIERAASDAAETVRRIQEFTRVRSHMDFVIVNLQEVVRDVIELTRPRWKDQAESKGIHITIQKKFGEVLPVLGSPSELREVLINLMANAIDAMPKGGEILIETGVEEDVSWISVTDEGTGMSRETQKRVFDPFFTTKGPQSSGLGMSVSYGIIKRHGGEILIKSNMRKGTTFSLLLPSARGEAALEEEVPPGKTLTPASILVVDDEEVIRKNLYDILSLEGHQVTLASGGEQGIEIFKRGDFDLVFTDLGMPEVSGWQVAKAIKQVDPKTPVVIITGWGANLDRKKMQASGIDFQISKPFRINQLLGLVSEGLDLRRRL